MLKSVYLSTVWELRLLLAVGASMDVTTRCIVLKSIYVSTIWELRPPAASGGGQAWT